MSIMERYIVTPGGKIQVSDDILEWGMWMEQSYGKPVEKGGRVVAQDDLPGDVYVSTVFLGIDHEFSGKGPPILFETMIFAPGNPNDEYQNRYATIEEARKGHAEALALVKDVKVEDDLPIAFEVRSLDKAD